MAAHPLDSSAVIAEVTRNFDYRVQTALGRRYVCDLFPCAKDALLIEFVMWEMPGTIGERQIGGPGVNLTRRTYCPTDAQMETLQRAGGWLDAIARLTATGQTVLAIEQMDAPEILRCLAAETADAAGQGGKPLGAQVVQSLQTQKPTAMTDCLDATSLALLRSSFCSLKSRFQAMADRGSPCKAWLSHKHNQPTGSATSHKWIDMDRGGFGTAASRQGMEFRLKDGRTIDNPPFTRMVQMTGWNELTPPGDDAARLLQSQSLPAEVAARLWRQVPFGTELNGGLPLWAMAVFEVANTNVTCSPLRAVRWVPLSGTERFELNSLQECFRHYLPTQNPPEFPDWFATLDNFAAASVQAIEVLLIWLDAVPTQATEATSEPPKPVERQAETLAGGKGAGDGQLQVKPCEGKAWSQFQEAVGKNSELTTDRQAYDWFTDEMADDAGELPSFANWSRYLRAARKAMNQGKNGPRIGNETRSVVSVERIEQPRKRIEADRR